MNDDDRGYTYRYGYMFAGTDVFGRTFVCYTLDEALAHLSYPDDVPAGPRVGVCLGVVEGWCVRNDNYGRNHEWRGPFSCREEAEGWSEP